MNCSTCFVPRPVICSWSSGSSLRFPSFVRHFEPPMKVISFGGWGSLTNKYRHQNSISISWGGGGGGGRGGGGRGGGSSRWSSSGNFGGGGWRSNRWVGGNSCVWSGSSCGRSNGGDIEVVQQGCAGGRCNACSSCSSGSLRGNGWLQRASSNQRFSSGRQQSRWNGGMGGGFSNSMNRFTNKWFSQARKQNNRYVMNGQSNGWNRWGVLGTKLNMFKSWFG